MFSNYCFLALLLSTLITNPYQSQNLARPKIRLWKSNQRPDVASRLNKWLISCNWSQINALTFISTADVPLSQTLSIHLLHWVTLRDIYAQCDLKHMFWSKVEVFISAATVILLNESNTPFSKKNDTIGRNINCPKNNL